MKALFAIIVSTSSLAPFVGADLQIPLHKDANP